MRTDRAQTRGVIFDLDGTLTKPHAINFKKMRERIGMPQDCKASSILHWIETQSIDEKERARMLAVVEEEEQNGLNRMELNDGFHQLAEILRYRADNLQTAICTRNGPSALQEFHFLMIRHGFAQGSSTMFPVQIARNHYSNSLQRALENKPSHEPAHEVLRYWKQESALSDMATVNVQPIVQDEAEPAVHPFFLFVGDHLDDCLAGRRAGWSSGLITNSEETLVGSYCHNILHNSRKRKCVDYTFSNLSELAMHLS